MEITAAIGKVPEVDLPVSETSSLSTTVEVGDRQKCKEVKCNHFCQLDYSSRLTQFDWYVDVSSDN